MRNSPLALKEALTGLDHLAVRQKLHFTATTESLLIAPRIQRMPRLRQKLGQVCARQSLTKKNVTKKNPRGLTAGAAGNIRPALGHGGFWEISWSGCWQDTAT